MTSSLGQTDSGPKPPPERIIENLHATDLTLRQVDRYNRVVYEVLIPPHTRMIERIPSGSYRIYADGCAIARVKVTSDAAEDLLVREKKPVRALGFAGRALKGVASIFQRPEEGPEDDRLAVSEARRVSVRLQNLHDETFLAEEINPDGQLSGLKFTVASNSVTVLNPFEFGGLLLYRNGQPVRLIPVADDLHSYPLAGPMEENQPPPMESGVLFMNDLPHVANLRLRHANPLDRANLELEPMGQASIWADAGTEWEIHGESNLVGRIRIAELARQTVYLSQLCSRWEAAGTNAAAQSVDTIELSLYNPGSAQLEVKGFPLDGDPYILCDLGPDETWTGLAQPGTQWRVDLGTNILAVLQAGPEPKQTFDLEEASRAWLAQTEPWRRPVVFNPPASVNYDKPVTLEFDTAGLRMPPAVDMFLIQAESAPAWMARLHMDADWVQPSFAGQKWMLANADGFLLEYDATDDPVQTVRLPSQYKLRREENTQVPAHFQHAGPGLRLPESTDTPAGHPVFRVEGEWVAGDNGETWAINKTKDGLARRFLSGRVEHWQSHASIPNTYVLRQGIEPDGRLHQLYPTSARTLQFVSRDELRHWDEGGDLLILNRKQKHDDLSGVWESESREKFRILDTGEYLFVIARDSDLKEVIFEFFRTEASGRTFMMRRRFRPIDARSLATPPGRLDDEIEVIDMENLDLRYFDTTTRLRRLNDDDNTNLQEQRESFHEWLSMFQPARFKRAPHHELSIAERFQGGMLGVDKYMLYGYNIYRMDPRYLDSRRGVDGRNMIFQDIPDDLHEYWEDNNYLIPSAFHYDPLNELTGETTESIYFDEQSQQSGYSVNVSVGGGPASKAGGGGKSGVDVGYGHSETKSLKTSRKNALFHAKKYGYRFWLTWQKPVMRLDTDFMLYLLSDDNFKIQNNVAGDLNAPNPSPPPQNPYDKFFETYGTHYPVGALFGGSFSVEKWADFSSVEKAMETEDKLSVEGTAQIKAVEVRGKMEASWKKSFGSKSSEEKEESTLIRRGGIGSSWDTFDVTSATQELVPVKVELMPIHELIRPELFGVTDPALSALINLRRERVKTELTRYERSVPELKAVPADTRYRIKVASLKAKEEEDVYKDSDGDPGIEIYGEIKVEVVIGGSKSNVSETVWSLGYDADIPTTTSGSDISPAPAKVLYVTLSPAEQATAKIRVTMNLKEYDDTELDPDETLVQDTFPGGFRELNFNSFVPAPSSPPQNSVFRARADGAGIVEMTLKVEALGQMATLPPKLPEFPYLPKTSGRSSP